MRHRPRTSSLIAIAPAVLTACAFAGCTQDFTAFESSAESLPGPDGGTDTSVTPGTDGAPSSTDGRADSTISNDGALPPVCGPAEKCKADAATCKSACDQTQSTCTAACGNNGACKMNCRDKGDVCKATCTSTCRTCATEDCVSACN